MSQIIAINEVTVTNIDLALEIANELKYSMLVDKKIRGSESLGIGSSVDYAFDLGNGKNFGLKLNEEGSYDIVCDNDTAEIVKRNFIVNYVKEFTINEIKLQGKEYSIDENDQEITIKYSI